jgi:hypothetical protein
MLNISARDLRLSQHITTSRNLIDDNVARIMYYAYVYPVLKYEILFWGISKN